MMDLKELKEYHDKAYVHGQVTRERASDDLVFYFVTQWDDTLLNESPLHYRGQFDMLRKAGRDILADLSSNPVSIEFQPKDDADEDSADFLSGMYITDERDNGTIEAHDLALTEAVVCGVGAWVLDTEYESIKSGNNNQVIRRRPVYEACNNLFWDPNAKRKDKSDATYCSILWAYSDEAYEELVEELTGDEHSVSEASFAQPEQSYTFPWINGGTDKKIYVTEFYHRKIVKDKKLTFVNMIGEERMLLESELPDQEDELIDGGFELVIEADIERYEVRKYIASGEAILNGEMDEETGERMGEVVPGDYIPVIPVYGEYAYVEGEPHYEGIVRLAKDPQRLRNFQLSYLADIVSRSPRNKPIVSPELIRGYEFMWEDAGADNNYPYLYKNTVDENGAPIDQTIDQLPDQAIPQALAASIELTAAAIADVANPGTPQDIADPDLSGKAVIALQNKMDKQSMIYQQGYKHAMRRDAQVYASMASVVIDSPRMVRTTKEDGTTATVKAMEMVQDERTGLPKMMNNIHGVEFDVYADIGPSYSSKREQTIDQIDNTIAQLQPGDPMAQLLTLKKLQLIPGVNFDDVRDYARKQSILAGFVEPETEEEVTIFQQAQMAKQGQPDPNMVLAQAELAKGQADLANAETDKAKAIADIEAKRQERLIKAYDSETKRFEANVSAEKAQAEITLKANEQIAREIDRRQSIMQRLQ